MQAITELELGGEDAQQDHEEDDGQDVAVGHGGEDVGGHYAGELVYHVHFLGGDVPDVAGEHHVASYARLDEGDQGQADDDSRQGGQQVVGEGLAQHPSEVAARHAGHSYEDGRGYQRDDYHVEGVEEEVTEPFDVLGAVRQEYPVDGAEGDAYEYLPV